MPTISPLDLSYLSDFLENDAPAPVSFLNNHLQEIKETSHIACLPVIVINSNTVPKLRIEKNSSDRPMTGKEFFNTFFLFFSNYSLFLSHTFLFSYKGCYEPYPILRNPERYSNLQILKY